jgi:chemotaxis protein CheY-P-specific phosphatase CheC
MQLEQNTVLTDAEQTKALLTETTMSALETMAFFCCEPASPDNPWPEQAVKFTMSFKGPQSGVVELVAGRFFGQRLASNALGCGVTDDEAVERATDSIQELINIVVGMMMPRLASSPGDVFDLGLPVMTEFDSATNWNDFLASFGATAIDAEGDTIALRIVK